MNNIRRTCINMQVRSGAIAPGRKIITRAAPFVNRKIAQKNKKINFPICATFSLLGVDFYGERCYNTQCQEGKGTESPLQLSKKTFGNSKKLLTNSPKGGTIKTSQGEMNLEN